MSTYTPNLGLHQWASSDYVNHEDFNSDNLKIDGALSHLYRVPIADYTTTAAANPLEIDLSGVSWGLFDQVYVEVTMTPTHSTFCNLHLNSAAENHNAWAISATGSQMGYGHVGELMTYGAEHTCRFRFDPFKIPSSTVSFELISQTSPPIWAGDGVLTYSGLNKLILAPYSADSYGLINSGAHVKIWGVK